MKFVTDLRKIGSKEPREWLLEKLGQLHSIEAKPQDKPGMPLGKGPSKSEPSMEEVISQTDSEMAKFQ